MQETNKEIRLLEQQNEVLRRTVAIGRRRTSHSRAVVGPSEVEQQPQLMRTAESRVRRSDALPRHHRRSETCLGCPGLQVDSSVLPALTCGFSPKGRGLKSLGCRDGVDVGIHGTAPGAYRHRIPFSRHEALTRIGVLFAAQSL